MEPRYTALIIDDEVDICELIEMSFMSINIDCVKAYSVNDAIVALQKQDFDVCFTDLKLPDGNGFEIIEYIQERKPNLPVAMMTAHGNVESAIEALKMGAFDFISKPFELEHLRRLALSAVQTKTVLSEQEATQKTITKKPNKYGMYGESQAMDEVRRIISRLARSQAPVYINGESGTGKELAARAIHGESGRSDGPFIAVNCGAIPEQLVESEFFGHKKGSFTGADRDKKGLFEAANNGTIFLDEVADLPLPMQVKLLRAIQERAVRPVGGTEEITINARIISASHKNLEHLVLEQEFRQDLFYRLNVITLNLPPLRERLEDLPILCHHLLERINEANGSETVITRDAIDALSHYNFPGNVRELENILERASALCLDQTITPEDLGLEHGLLQKQVINRDVARIDATLQEGDTKQETIAEYYEPDENDEIIVPKEVTDIDDYLARVENKIISQALENNRNKTEAAKSLGISFRQFRYRLKKHNIEED